MSNYFKIFSLLFLTLGSFFIYAPQSVSAEFNPLCPTTDPSTGKCTSGACQGNAADSPLCKQAASQDKKDPIAGPSGIISKAANLIAIITAIGAVIMILIGAFEFVTAGGTGFKSAVAGAAPTRVAKARARIASGLIGLVVVALAWALVRLITDKVLK